MKKTKRFLTILLSLTLVLSFMPAMAFADVAAEEEGQVTEQQAVESAEAQDADAPEEAADVSEPVEEVAPAASVEDAAEEEPAPVAEDPAPEVKAAPAPEASVDEVTEEEPTEEEPTEDLGDGEDTECAISIGEEDYEYDFFDDIDHSFGYSVEGMQDGYRLKFSAGLGINDTGDPDNLWMYALDDDVLDAEEGKVIVHTSKVTSSDAYLNYDETRMVILAEVLDAEGNRVAWDQTNFWVEPAAEIFEADDDDVYVVRGDRLYGINDSAYSQIYNSQYPNGYYAEYKLTDVVVADKTIAIARHEASDVEEWWYFQGVKAGTTKATLTYAYVDPRGIGQERTIEINVIVVDYDLDINYSPSRQEFLKNEKVDLSAHVNIDEDEGQEPVPSTAKYEWSFEYGDDIATLTADGKTAQLAFSGTGGVNVVLKLTNNGQLLGQAECYFSANERRYEIVMSGDDLDNGIPVGETANVSVNTMKYTLDNPAGEPVSDVRYEWEYDEEHFSVEGSGSDFQITRLDNEEGDLNLYAYDSEDSLLDEESFWIEGQYYELSFEEEEGEFYNDGDFTLNLDTSEIETSKPYTIEYSVSAPNGTYDEEGSMNYSELDNADNKYFTASGNQITLHGPAFWEEVKEYPDEQFAMVTARVKVGSSVIGDCSTYVGISESRVEYDIDTDDRELCLWESDEIYPEIRCSVYNAENPGGKHLNLAVKSVNVVEGSSVTVNDEDGYYNVEPKSLGKSVVRISYEDYYGNDAYADITYNILKERFYLYIDNANLHNWNYAPGESTTLKAEGEHAYMVDDEETYDSKGMTYSWKLVGDAADYATLTPYSSDSSKATIKFKSDVDPSIFAEGSIPVTVQVDAKYDGSVRKSDTYELDLVHDYYLLWPRKVNSIIPVGSTYTYDPKIYYHEMNKSSVVADAQYFRLYFDEDCISITDANGNKLESGDKGNGPFKIKRLDTYSCSINVEAYVPDEDEEDGWYVDDTDLYIEELIDISDTWVEDIEGRTYTGSAIKPKVHVWWDDELVEGTDYTVSYKNNTNAGTATVTITGKGKYYGSTTETFTIYRKSITPTITIETRTYTGSHISPKVTVTYNGKTLSNSTDYSYSFASSTRKSVGSYKCTITLKGNYKGTFTKYQTIKPKNTYISSLTKGSKKFTVKWPVMSTKMTSNRITGYQIQYSRDKNFSKNVYSKWVKGYSNKSTTITGLSSKATYYARIRTYMVINGTYYYSFWSSSKSVKTN